MNVISVLFWGIFVFLILLAAIVGVVIFLVVRKNERKNREAFHWQQAQAAQHRTQEEELKKMKIDDL